MADKRGVVKRLIDGFADLPGIGRRTAERLAYHVLNMPKEQALAFADGQLSHLKSAEKISGDINTQLGLLEFADDTINKRDGTRIACPRDGNDASQAGDATASADADVSALPWRRVCPGVRQQPFLGQKLHRAGRVRTCVLVNVPEGGGALEIALGPHPWLPFLTRIRSGIDSRDVVDGEIAQLTVFGDGKQGQERDLGFGATSARVTFPSSSNHLVVRLSGDQAFGKPVCLTFTESAWWNTTLGKSADDAVAADDEHGAAPRER
jgi:hypothetical protein